MSMDWVIEANSLSADLLRPDLNIYIDITPDLSMKRLSNGRSSLDLYETKENLKNVRKKYLEAFDHLKFKENVFITNGNKNEYVIGNNSAFYTVEADVFNAVYEDKQTLKIINY